MENKHTAMQQLINEIVEHLTYDDNLSDDSRMTLETIRLRCLSKLSIEKEQIIDSYKYGNQSDVYFKPEQYYIETYESKESDAKDVILGYKTSLDAQMLDKIKLKQETLEETAERIYPIHIKSIIDKYDDGITNVIGKEDINEDNRESFKEGAKWRQEQILQFLYSEIIERRPYSSSKMCEVVIEFIEQLNTKK